MALSRAAALRSCFRATRPTALRPQLCRHIVRRGYASAGHGSTKAGGDAVWAAGAVAVTVPTCWYLLANGPDTSHGHDEHHDAHEKSHDDEGGEGEGKEESDGDGEEPEGGEEKSEEKTDDNASKSSGDSDSDNEGGDTPDTSDDEGKADTKKAAEEVETSVTKKMDSEQKHIPDAKGGAKKRLESEQGKKQGQEAQGSVDGSGPEDAPATSKPAGDQNTTSGKQEGLSNTDTKHSTPITERPDTPTKGEGTPETAKAKGTIDPKRPQA